MAEKSRIKSQLAVKKKNTNKVNTRFGSQVLSPRVIKITGKEGKQETSTDYRRHITKSSAEFQCRKLKKRHAYEKEKRFSARTDLK